MISNTLFITYTIMCFLSLQAITFVIFMIKHNDSGSTKLIKAMRNFVIVSLVLGLFYYTTYYKELVLGQFATSTITRGLDAIIFYAMGHSWVRLVDAIIDSQNPKMEWWRKHTNIVFLTLMVLSIAIYTLLLDDYYAADYLWAEIVAIGFEVLLGVTVVVFTIAYVTIGYREIRDGFSKKYIIASSIFINFNNIWNNTVVIFVFLKAVDLSTRCSPLYGVTSILLLVINLCTILYMYKKDFSPFFSGQKVEAQKTRSEAEILDFVAEKHRLTERERDVMILAYQGLSNPDIAERLFISKHTVKRHMHNIFEKLNVSTRVELIHLIQTETAP